MSTRPWIFLINTFEVNTRGSNPKMLSLSTDTDSKLHAEIADPDILAIYTDYHPVYLAYVAIFQNYQVVAGDRQGNTLNVEELMSEGLPLELRKWEAAVRNVYPEDTAQEVAIFPNKREPFQTGTYETRIQAVGALAVKLAADVAFSALAPQVLSYYNVLLSARDTQQQKEGLLGQLSDVREQQRLLVAESLYGIVLGQLMKRFRGEPSQIARFFDLTLLRETGEEENILSTFQDLIAPTTTVNITTIPPTTTKARVTVLAGGPLEFGLSTDGVNFNGNTVTLGAPGEQEVLLSDFASTGTQFLVRNQNGSVQGEYKVEFIA